MGLGRGVGVGDGLSLLAEEADCPEDRAMLTRMAGQVDEGASLAEALRSSGCFPDYVASLAEVGQRSGHMEEALTALADYYDGRCRMEHRLRSSSRNHLFLIALHRHPFPYHIFDRSRSPDRKAGSMRCSGATPAKT